MCISLADGSVHISISSVNGSILCRYMFGLSIYIIYIQDYLNCLPTIRCCFGSRALAQLPLIPMLSVAARAKFRLELCLPRYITLLHRWSFASPLHLCVCR